MVVAEQHYIAEDVAEAEPAPAYTTSEELSIEQQLIEATTAATEYKKRAETAEAALVANAAELRRNQESIATLRAARWSALPIATAAAEEATAAASLVSQRLQLETGLLAHELLTTEHALQDASTAALALGSKAEEYLQLLAAAAEPAAATPTAAPAPASRRRQVLQEARQVRQEAKQAYGPGPASFLPAAGHPPPPAAKSRRAPASGSASSIGGPLGSRLSSR